MSRRWIRPLLLLVLACAWPSDDALAQQSPLAALIETYEALQQRAVLERSQGREVPIELSTEIRNTVVAIAHRGVEGERFLISELDTKRGEQAADIVEALLAVNEQRVVRSLTERIEAMGPRAFRVFFEDVSLEHYRVAPAELTPYVTPSAPWRIQAVMNYLARLDTPEAARYLIECPLVVCAFQPLESSPLTDTTLVHFESALLDLTHDAAIKQLLAVFKGKPQNFAAHVEEFDLRVITRVAGVLGALGCTDATPSLSRCLQHPHEPLATAAARSLGELRDRSTFDALKKAYQRRDKGEFSLVSLEALAKIDPLGARSFLLRAAKHSNWRMRSVAATGLGDIDDAKCRAKLMKLLRDDEWQVRKAAFEVLSKSPDRELLGTLIDTLDDQRGYLRARIYSALVAWTGKNFGPHPDIWQKFWAEHGETFHVLQEPLPKGFTFVDPNTPRYFGLEILSQDVAFLIDTSGSMAIPYEYRTGSGKVVEVAGIDLVKRELAQVLNALEDGEQSFNIVAFATRFRPLFAGPKKASSRTRKSAGKFLSIMRAGGGTNLYDPLEELVKDGHYEAIYILSDGTPTMGKIRETKPFLQAIDRLNRYSRATIHCIALGESSELLEALAESTGGEYRRVDHNDYTLDNNKQQKGKTGSTERDDTEPDDTEPSGTNPTDTHPNDTYRRGEFTAQFEERSPLSAPKKLASRDRFNAKSGVAEYELDDQSFLIHVPREYTATDGRSEFGLLVWIDPSEQGRVWHREVLARQKLIVISPNDAGNDTSHWIRTGLALDAVHNMRARYPLAPDRIYVAGFSGGGRMASRLGVMYADVFDGAFCIDGTDWYKDLPADESPGQWFQGRYQKPRSAIWRKARTRNRYVLMTGEHDGNRPGTHAAYQHGFKKKRFKHVQYIEVPGKGHALPDEQYFAGGLRALEPPSDER